jgi:translation initiation factor IF-2
MTNNSHTISRPPVIAVMGHIDHGKSTLLDFIRKSNVTEKEAGGITQHVSAYEVVHKTPTGEEKKITFLDTPGHAAFSGIRNRGAQVADIAILVVSAEDGVKPQTLEALSSIQNANIPFVVAITKIDKPEANIDRTKQSLAENEVYVEGYGGNISVVPISAKTGEGIPELLDMLLLTAEIKGCSADMEKAPYGIVIESSTNPKKGLGATLIVKEGVLKKGVFTVSGTSFAPVRMMENFLGKPISEALPGTPVKIIGWNFLPQVGTIFTTVSTKKEAEAITLETNLRDKEQAKLTKQEPEKTKDDMSVTIPLIIEADTAGSLEAILLEIGKISVERVYIKIIQRGIGRVTESDIKLASHDPKSIILNFGSAIESGAISLATRLGIEIHEFNIIYKMTEWLEQALKDLAPTVEVEEIISTIKVLKFFSKDKDKQVIGGRVLTGTVPVGSLIKVMRRGEEVSRGKIRGLQQQKIKAQEVDAPKEFGGLVESKIEIAPGDELHAYHIIEKK